MLGVPTARPARVRSSSRSGSPAPPRPPARRSRPVHRPPARRPAPRPQRADQPVRRPAAPAQFRPRAIRRHLPRPHGDHAERAGGWVVVPADCSEVAVGAFEPVPGAVGPRSSGGAGDELTERAYPGGLQRQRGRQHDGEVRADLDGQLPDQAAGVPGGPGVEVRLVLRCVAGEHAGQRRGNDTAERLAELELLMHPDAERDVQIGGPVDGGDKVRDPAGRGAGSISVAAASSDRPVRPRHHSVLPAAATTRAPTPPWPLGQRTNPAAGQRMYGWYDLGVHVSTLPRASRRSPPRRRFLCRGQEAGWGTSWSPVPVPRSRSGVGHQLISGSRAAVKRRGGARVGQR
jgi:hypothetical protein